MRSSAMAARSANTPQLSEFGVAWRKGVSRKLTSPNFALYTSMGIPSAAPSRNSCTSSSNTIGSPRAGAMISAVWRARVNVLEMSTSAAISPVAANRSRKCSAWVTPSGDSRVSPMRLCIAPRASPCRIKNKSVIFPPDILPQITMYHCNILMRFATYPLGKV